MEVLKVELVVELVIVTDAFQPSFDEIVDAGPVVIVIFPVESRVMGIPRPLTPLEVFEPFKWF